jgi:hypothetical protein
MDARHASEPFLSIGPGGATPFGLEAIYLVAKLHVEARVIEGRDLEGSGLCD